MRVCGQDGYRIHGEPQTQSWPDWANPAERSTIGPRCCHPNGQVQAAFKAEAGALATATQLALAGHASRAIAAAKDFLALGESRRALLGNDRSFCELNEAAMEMVEGAAKSIGDAADLTSGTRRADQVISFADFALGSLDFTDVYYYWFGEQQLYRKPFTTA